MTESRRLSHFSQCCSCSTLNLSDLDSFDDKIANVALSGYTLVGIRLGQELGLFSLLAEQFAPLSAEEIAEKARCKQRYIKEWLHHMVVADILETDSNGTKFLLPLSHRHALTSNDGVLTRTTYLLPHMFLGQRRLVRNIRDEPEPDHICQSDWSAGECCICADEHTTSACLDHLTRIIPQMQERVEKGARICCVCCHETKQLETKLNEVCGKSTFYFYSADVERRGYPESRTMRAENSAEDTFEIIVILDSLHHSAMPQELLADAYKLLVTGGHFVLFDTFLFSNPYLTASNLTTKRIGLEKYPQSLYYGTSLQTGGFAGMFPGMEQLGKFIKEAGFVIRRADCIPNTAKMAFMCSKKEPA